MYLRILPVKPHYCILFISDCVRLASRVTPLLSVVRKYFILFYLYYTFSITNKLCKLTLVNLHSFPFSPKKISYFIHDQNRIAKLFPIFLS